MQRRNKFILAVALVTAIGGLAVAGTSYAHKWRGQHQGFYGMQEMGPGFHGRGHGRQGMRFFQQFDANGDGQLTQEEIDTTRNQRMAEFDRDQDGTLSLEEFEALWLDFMRPRMVDRFQHLDENGDAVVTLEEFQAPFERIVARMDRNGDGVLSPEDRPRRGKGYYRDYDDDDDDDDRRDN